MFPLEVGFASTMRSVKMNTWVGAASCRPERSLPFSGSKVGSTNREGRVCGVVVPWQRFDDPDEPEEPELQELKEAVVAVEATEPDLPRFIDHSWTAPTRRLDRFAMLDSAGLGDNKGDT